MTETHDEDTLAAVGRTCLLLADASRLRMLRALAAGGDREWTVQELGTAIGRMSPAMVGHHLRLLRTAGLVQEGGRQQPLRFRLRRGVIIAPGVLDVGDGVRLSFKL
jgi:DNA-binding transcriptional ArsR family regulator